MNDDLLVIAILETLAYLGLVVPAIISHFGYPQIAAIVLVIWWGFPAAPIPILHVNLGGWMPYIVAYPMALVIACDSFVETRKWDGAMHP